MGSCYSVRVKKRVPQAGVSAVKQALNQISVERSEGTASEFTSQSAFLCITYGYELWVVTESMRLEIKVAEPS